MSEAGNLSQNLQILSHYRTGTAICIYEGCTTFFLNINILMPIINEQFLLLLYQKKLKLPRLINFTNQTNRLQKKTYKTGGVNYFKSFIIEKQKQDVIVKISNVIL